MSVAPGAWPELRALLERAFDATAEACAEMLADLERTDPGRALELEALLRGDRVEASILDAGASLGLLGLDENGSPGGDDALAAGFATGQLRGALGRGEQVLSHYLIGNRLGAGGMGEVFLARDLALGRAAAVKVLTRSLAPDARARLLREGEASARLQHPGIATFYEAGEAAGIVFLAMEYVPGETLRERLRRGPLAEPEAVLVVSCLLEALVHAHAAGVLHRDIKPENVMITGGGAAKLLDFGIARVIGWEERDPGAPTAIALTGASGVVGTIGYMSPEQLEGRQLDERSDLFSLGAVLFEALAGRPAFPGETAAMRIAAILRADPPLTAVPEITPEMRGFLARALGRERARRYPSAAAMLAELRAISSGDFVGSLPDSLTVVDFRNLSRDPDDDWIGSGIAESLRSDLLRIPGLSVVARERLLELRAGRQRTAGEAEELELGRLLGCRWVVSGSYQRVGRRLRITSSLIEVATGDTVASEKVDGVLDDIFRLQDQLAVATEQRLRRGDGALERRTVPRLDAFERHARGRRLFLQLEKGSLDQAQELYELAVGLDSGYAPALAGLAAVHAMRFTFTTDTRELGAAADYARRAIEADPELVEPRIWLGYALLRQGRFDDGLEQERRAMELDPAAVLAPYFAGCCAALPGRHAEGLVLFQRTLEMEPRHGWAWLGLGWAHLELGSGAEARWCLERAVELERLRSPHPTAGVSGYLGECLRRLGDLAGARQRCLEGLEAVERSDNMYRDTFRAFCLCALGRTALAQRDEAAAHAAFAQAVTHLRGRRRALGGGHLLVQALAGLAQSGAGGGPFEEALGLFRSRPGYDFSLMWACSDGVTLLDLARAAAALGRGAESLVLLAEARRAGSKEAAALDAP